MIKLTGKAAKFVGKALTYRTTRNARMTVVQTADGGIVIMTRRLINRKDRNILVIQTGLSKEATAALLDAMHRFNHEQKLFK